MSRQTTDPMLDVNYRKGWKFARDTLAEEPREIREATLREFDQARRAWPTNHPQHTVFEGASAFLVSLAAEEAS